MEGMLVGEGSHHDFVCQKRELLRVVGALLHQEIEDMRSSVWAETNSQQTDLIPGLPDELVERKIWPRLRNYVEITILDSPPMKRLKDIPSMVRKLLCCMAVSSINKKWRFLCISSKPWAGIKLLRLEIPNANYYDEFILNMRAVYFQYYMRILPPLDSLTMLPLPCGDSHIIALSANKTCILRWFQGWAQYDKEERDILLQLYPGKQGKLGQDRLAIWKNSRDLMEPWYHWRSLH